MSSVVFSNCIGRLHGNTLAGIIAGLAAPGATLEQATAWGVALLHKLANNSRIG